MNLQEWNKRQLSEALSPENRYFYWLKHRREGSEQELILHYILEGGAEHYRQDHGKELEDEEKQY